MTSAKDKVPAKQGWIHDNPYLLLALAALFWSGNHIVGRAIGGEVPPIGISTVRWLLPTIALGLFAFQHIKRDWPVIRTHWGILLWLGIIGGPAAGGCVTPLSLNPGPCAWTIEATFSWHVFQQLITQGAIAGLAGGLVVVGVKALLHRKPAEELRPAGIAP